MRSFAKVEIAGKKGPTIVDTDESPRKDTTLEALAKLRPAFPGDAPKDMKPEELTVTAGNAPGLNDGGSALVVASEDYAKAHGLPILARITGYASGGGDRFCRLRPSGRWMRHGFRRAFCRARGVGRQ